MILMFDDHDLDERYQYDYDHSITYERVFHAYDDHEIVNLGTMISLEDIEFLFSIIYILER